MKLSREDVLQLADLARLSLSEEEMASTEKNLSSILGYVDRLSEIDTDGVEPSGLAPRAEGWRKDIAFPADEVTREYVLSNFPSRKGDLLRTPGVFEKPKGSK